jgi:hypothetical protein
VPTRPVDSVDEIIELYKKDVDRTLIRENLRLSYEERLLNLQRAVDFALEARRAGEAMRRRKQ